MLETIWFALWGVLWAVYFVLDGFDLGLGSLMPVVAKNERDRRVVVNAMGPFWDGNEVWLITAGGVTFAAFPRVYAVMFSSLYTPLMLLLFALILRGISFRPGQGGQPRLARLWDATLVIGSFLPALLLGVAFANIFKGLPLDAQGILQGNLLTLLIRTGCSAAFCSSCCSSCTAPSGSRSRATGPCGHAPGERPACCGRCWSSPRSRFSSRVGSSRRSTPITFACRCSGCCRSSRWRASS